jgi:hypothetical protein
MLLRIIIAVFFALTLVNSLFIPYMPTWLAGSYIQTTVTGDWLNDISSTSISSYSNMKIFFGSDMFVVVLLIAGLVILVRDIIVDR